MELEKLKNATPQCNDCGWVGKNKYMVLIAIDGYRCPECWSTNIIWIGSVTLNEFFEEMKNHYLGK